MAFEDNTVTHAKMGTDKVVGVDAGNSQRIAIGIDVPGGVVNRHITDIGRIVYHAIPCTEKCSFNHRFNLLARGSTVAAQGETGTTLRTIDRNEPDGKRTTGVGGRDKYFLSLIVTRAIVDFRTDRAARARTVIDIERIMAVDVKLQQFKEEPVRAAGRSYRDMIIAGNITSIATIVKDRHSIRRVKGYCLSVGIGIQRDRGHLSICRCKRQHTY